MPDDTIYALSTGAGAAGIAVIRVSGPQTRDALRALCGVVPRPREATLRTIRDPATQEAIDSGVILFFPAPASFTGGDLAELQVHGSLAIIREILRVLSTIEGLRAASAGEFTQRAFHAGKMDLTEIEALGDLLVAETAAQARLARQARTSISQAGTRWRTLLLDAIALTEAQIDFADEGDIDPAIDSSVKRIVAGLSAELSTALEGLQRGNRVRQGFRIVVAGPPNAGKSSLVNALADREIAITSPIAGTTRDAIETHLDLGGFPVVLIDTAGIRDTEDVLERAGMARTRAALASADMILWLVPTGDDIIDQPPGSLLIRTKADLDDSLSKQMGGGIRVSTLSGEGLSELATHLRQRASSGMTVDLGEVVVANERQSAEIAGAHRALVAAVHGTAETLELRAEHLRIARIHLDRLTGRIDNEEVLGVIFSRFCIGK